MIDLEASNVGQALRSFELFTGQAPDPARMDAHFRRLVTPGGALVRRR